MNNKVSIVNMYQVKIKAFSTSFGTKTQLIVISKFESNESITKQVDETVRAFFEEGAITVRVSEESHTNILNVKPKDLTPPSALNVKIANLLGLTLSHLELASQEVMKVREDMVRADSKLSQVFTPMFEELLASEKYEEAILLTRQLPECATKNKALARLQILE